MPINYYEDNSLSWSPDKTLLVRPIYKSLLQLLEQDILSGKLQKNTKLPSQRELADFLDINFTTVGHTYKEALSKGLLYTNIGAGTFISPNAFEAITISNYNIKTDTINLGLISPFDECSSLIMPIVKKVSTCERLSLLLDYRNPMGTPYQLLTANKWLKSQGVKTSPENISIISGVQNGLAVTLTALFSPGDRIATDRYTYSNFIELAHLLHLEIVPINFDKDGMLPEELLRECSKKKINGIFLMPSCNNPIGFQISEQRRIALSKIIKEHHLWVIEDDIHSFLTIYFQNKVLPTFHSLIPEQTIYLAGITKYISSGFRVAYIAYPESLQQRIQRAIFNINVKTSGFAAEVITEVLDSPISKAILEKKFKLTQDANQIFDNIFNLSRPTNMYPFYRNIPISDVSLPPKEIEKFFLKYGIQVYHSYRFTVHPQKDSFIRVSLSSNELSILDSALKRVKRGLKDISKRD